eukprot:m.918843 g.918843  ORF g.918843 m.918843 type:complete len:287 (-) comp23747_c0_seq8:474-1334(-)
MCWACSSEILQILSNAFPHVPGTREGCPILLPFSYRTNSLQSFETAPNFLASFNPSALCTASSKPLLMVALYKFIGILAMSSSYESHACLQVTRTRVYTLDRQFNPEQITQEESFKYTLLLLLKLLHNLLIMIHLHRVQDTLLLQFAATFFIFQIVSLQLLGSFSICRLLQYAVVCKLLVVDFVEARLLLFRTKCTYRILRVLLMLRFHLLLHRRVKLSWCLRFLFLERSSLSVFSGSNVVQFLLCSLRGHQWDARLQTVEDRLYPLCLHCVSTLLCPRCADVWSI